MGRWLVILSLAMTQCPDIVVASPQPSSDIPVPKPRPTRRHHHVPAIPAPAVKAVTVPLSPSPWPVEEPDSRSSAPAERSFIPGRRSLRDADSVEQYPIHTSPALSPVEAVPDAFPDEPVRSRRAGGACGDGKRIVSSYYWEGQRTATGERFNPHGMTAAHRTLPFGTRLNVSNPHTGKTVTVVINDRGPFVSGVGLDLSLGAAQAIGMRGTGTVCIW
jgi:rare lipoprotein A